MIEKGVVINFFFQAEDGIRNYKVTGVQTCALPIYSRFFLVSFLDCLFILLFLFKSTKPAQTTILS